MISKKLSYFLVFPDMFCIFVPMEDYGTFIQDVLNRKEYAINKFYELLFDVSNSIINYSFDNCRNKSSLKKELANELYMYFMDNLELLQKFKGNCKLTTYLNSIGKHYFFSTRFDVDPVILEANREWKKLERKQERMIRKIDNEPENFHVIGQTHIPTEFQDEDEDSADAFFLFAIDDENHNDKKNDHADDIIFVNDDFDDDNDDNDIIVDVDKIINTYSEVVYTNKCQLVRQTLDQMPPKQAELLKLQFYKGIKDNKELAMILGITINTLYNLRNRAIESFITCFNHLKRQQYEEN